MGAVTITTFIETTQTLHDAWKDLWENERFEHGSDAYSGSFATCDGVIDLGITPLGLPEANLAAEMILSGNPLPGRLHGTVRTATLSKWGPSGAVAVVDPTGARTLKKTVTVKHTEPGTLSRTRMIELVRERIDLPAGSYLDCPQLIDDTTRTRTTVTRGKGTLSTVYMLGGRGVGNQEHPTERAAIDAAKVISAQRLERGLTDTEITITTVRRRSEGPTTVNSEIVGRTSKISVEVVTPKDPTKISGYLFFAWAAC